MANVNTAKPIPFESGGIFTLTASAVDYVFFQIEPGTLRFEPGGYEPLNFTDRGVQQSPLEGDERISKISVDLKLTSLAATQVYTLLSARDTATGLMKQFTVKIQWPTVKGGVTGHQILATRCYAATVSPIEAGTKFDIVKVMLESLDALPAPSTY